MNEPISLFSDLILHNKLLFVTENHTAIPPKKFFLEVLPIAASSGVRKVGMEMMDAGYRFSGQDNELFGMLHKKWNEYNSESPQLYVDIIKLCQAFDIEVVGIDTRKDGAYDLGECNRDWARHIGRHLDGMPPNSKMIVYGGNSHFIHRSGCVTAVNDVLQYPVVRVISNPNYAKEYKVYRADADMKDYVIHIPPAHYCRRPPAVKTPLSYEGGHKNL